MYTLCIIYILHNTTRTLNGSNNMCKKGSDATCTARGLAFCLRLHVGFQGCELTRLSDLSSLTTHHNHIVLCVIETDH